MKKLSYEQWLWQQRKLRKKLRRLRKNTKHSPKGAAFTKHKGAYSLVPPALFSLRENYEEVARFLSRLRDEVSGRKGNDIGIDFTKIVDLRPGAALVLAAELDRWRKAFNKPLRPVKLNEWIPEVRKLCNEMGMFSLLKVSSKSRLIRAPSNQKFFPFLTRNKVDGTWAVILQKSMSGVIGERVNGHKMYRALNEAMTNVSNHAYPEGHRHRYRILKKRWWMSGSYNKNRDTATIMVCDQGVGIPTALQKQDWYHNVIKWLGGESRTDGKLIQGAMKVGRSGTKQGHRGHGLSWMQDFAEANKNSEIHIISGHGYYMSRDGKETVENHKQEFVGTFIQWDIKLEE